MRKTNKNKNKKTLIIGGVFLVASVAAFIVYQSKKKGLLNELAITRPDVPVETAETFETDDPLLNRPTATFSPAMQNQINQLVTLR